MKTKYKISTIKIIGLKEIFFSTTTEKKRDEIMKIENETLVILPNGKVTSGERIVRALTLEEKMLQYAKGDQDAALQS